MRHAKEFLSDGHSIRVVLKLHGREKAHPEIGRQQMSRFLSRVKGTDENVNGHHIQHLGPAFMAFLRPSILTAGIEPKARACPRRRFPALSRLLLQEKRRMPICW